MTLYQTATPPLKYITKWALTDGIVQRKVHCSMYNNSLLFTLRYEDDSFTTQVPKHHIHDTLEEAQAYAEKMRQQAIAKCEDKLLDLENMRF